MVERINLLLKAKNITARQFAEEIGIQPSGMSHILSGRNNPSLDFVMKVVKRWPEVNINWLMFGKGEMYAGLPLSASEHPKQEGAPVLPTQEVEQYDLFAPQELQSHAAMVEETSKYGYKESVSQPMQSPVRKVESMPYTPLSVPPSAPTEPAHEDLDASMQQHAENVVETANPSSMDVQPTQKKKKVVKMIVVYDDHSFTEYFPE